MTPGTGGALTVSMLELTTQLIQDFTAVLFLNGTLTQPGSDLSALAIQALNDAGIAFKAVDCDDDQYNPGVRAVVEELVGECALPQLFVAGQQIGNGSKIEEMQAGGGFRQKLIAAGAVPAE